jgi:hypothetical protein
MVAEGQNPKIVVSYRRSDSAMAGRIFDRLAQHFGKSNLFIDIDNVPFGRFRRNSDRQRDEPGCCRNTTSSSVEVRPKISFRCGKRPKRSMIALCRIAKSRLSGLPSAEKSSIERA